MGTRRLLAPAKLNLGLRIVGVRADGYHELSSLFVPLDLADEVTVEVAPAERARVTIEVEAAAGVPGDVPADSSNLAARAALAFLEAAGLAAAVHIRLEKRIPSPGGLGGGSSDAAAVLRALAAEFPGALAGERLESLGLGLGADVPFFLGPGGEGPVPARVEGIGERVAPAPGVPSLAAALVHAGPPLETARVYAEFDASGASLTGERAPTTMPAPAGWLAADWLSTLLVNDLEAPATRLAPGIAPLREALAAAGARGVGLSGSGPTLFGIFPDASSASEALSGARLREELARTGAAQAFTGVARTVASGEAR